MHLVRAVCSSGGPIPRPPSNSNNSALSWDTSELCLELLFTVLLRNRDRITLLWPRAYEHFAVRESRASCAAATCHSPAPSYFVSARAFRWTGVSRLPFGAQALNPCKLVRFNADHLPTLSRVRPGAGAEGHHGHDAPVPAPAAVQGG